MKPGRPQLSLDELLQLRWLLGGVLALFSVWTVFYLDIDTWTLLVQSTVAVTAALIWPRLPSYIPRWVHIAAFPCIAIVFAVDFWLTQQLLPAMIRLDLMLILYRGASYRQRREDLQLIVLGLFLVVVAGVLTVSLAFAAQIVGFSACALALLLVITLVESSEAKYPPVRTPLFTWGIIAPTPAWTRHAGWRRLFSRIREIADWRVAGLGAVLFAGVVAFSALLFFSIPRFQLENSLFLDRFISRKVRTGFTENVRFGDVTDIMADNSVAMRVDISDPGQLPATPYFRMVVLDDYHSGGFQMSRALRTRSFGPEQNMRYIPGTSPAPAADPVYWTFFFEPGVSRFLPIPGPFSGLGFNEVQNVAWSNELALAALRNDPASMVAYRLENAVTTPAIPDFAFAAAMANARTTGLKLTSDFELNLALNDADKATLLRQLSDATGGLAPGAAAALDPAAFAGRVCQWLADKHAYSTQSTLPAGDGDPLVRWLGSPQPGHCELFAGAFVLLAREAGIPARLVCGFKGGSWNAFNKYLTVRNSDAHAWCELWDGRTGSWLRVDPTPGATAVATADEPRGEAAMAKRTDNSWSARLDSLRILWYRRIVSFDQNAQIDTVRGFRDAARGAGLRAREALDRLAQSLKAWLTTPWSARRVGGLVGGLLALAGFGWLVRAAFHGWRWRSSAGGRRADPIRVEAGRWLLRMEGQRDDPGVVAALLRLRYGERGTWPRPDLTFRRARRAWRAARRR